MGKGKVHYIEVLSDEEDDGEDETHHIHDSGQRIGKAERPHLEVAEEKELHDRVKKVTINTLLGVPKYYTFKVRGILQG
jgi:hypothetical protein